MKKGLWLMLAVLFALGMLAGCGTANTAPSATPEISATQTAQPTQEATQSPAAVMRIVSTVPSATEILFALGVGEDIVGVDVSSTYPAQTADIEKVGDYNGFDVEKIIALAPDVVFAGNTLQADQIAQLKAAGLNIVSVDPTGYDDIVPTISLVGETVNKADEAAALGAQITSAAEAVKAKAAEIADKPTVYYVMGIGEYGNWTSGEGSFINTVIGMCGGTCVTAGTNEPWIDYPVEDLVKADPDILIVSSLVAEDALKAETGYADMTAVKSGHYYFIDPDLIELPGPRIAQAFDAIQQDILSFLGA